MVPDVQMYCWEYRSELYSYTGGTIIVALHRWFICLSKCVCVCVCACVCVCVCVCVRVCVCVCTFMCVYMIVWGITVCGAISACFFHVPNMHCTGNYVYT